MVDYYALTGSPLPQPLHGADADYSIRTLSEHERLAIEDYYFSRDTKVALDPATTAVVVANQTEKTALEQFAVLIEFALGILTVSGFSLTAVLSLALGIGATTAVFSVLYAALMNPFPFVEADRIFRLTVQTKNDGDHWINLNGPQIRSE